MSCQGISGTFKKVHVTQCTSVFSFEWRIEDYYPECYLSEDFSHPLFPDDLWFIRVDPPPSPYVQSCAMITITPKKTCTSKIAITLEWNDTVILRTMFDPSLQALRAKHTVKDGYETLIGSTICLRCNLYYPKKLLPEKSLPSRIEDDLKRFLADSCKLKSTADFKLICSDGVNCVQAHRFVLAARSPYFRAMLSMDSEERRKDSVHLKSTPITVLTNALPLIYDEPKDLAVLNLDEAIDLFKFADQYDFPHIKLILECHLATRLSFETLPSIEQIISHVDSEILSRAVANVNQSK